MAGCAAEDGFWIIRKTSPGGSFTVESFFAKNKWIQKIVLVLSLVFVFQSFSYDYKLVTNPEKADLPRSERSGYLEEWTAGTGQKDVANYLLSEEAKGNKVVVFTEGTFGTLPDGLQIYTEGHKNITIVGSTPNIYVIPDGLLNSDKSNQRYYVLNASRNHLPASEMAKLELIKEFPKSVRPDGSHESLLFFRLK